MRRPAPGHRASAGAAFVVALLLALAGPAAAPAAAAVGEPVTYAGHTYASSAGAASADKPQSKLWFHDGSWWALMTADSSVNVFRLSGHTWVDTGTVVDTRAASTGDALWEAATGKLYVVTRAASGSGAVRVVRFSYGSGSQRFTRDSGYPVRLRGGGTESATIARDGVGRLWVTFTRGSRVWVAHSTTSDASWTSPFRVPGADTTVSADDISAVIGMPGGVGVMWSDQQSSVFRFATHADGAPTDEWSVETALSGPFVADDHINLKSLLGDDQGRVHAAVKTSLNDGGGGPSEASILVLSRTADGTWGSAVAARVSDSLTRPQLALDRTNRLLFVLASTEGGGTIWSKSTPLGSIAFGTGTGSPFMTSPGAGLNDVSTSKEPVDARSGLVAIATDSDAHRYYHAEMSLGATSPDPGPPPPPPAPTGTQTVTVPPVADAYVKGSVPNQTFGDAVLLDVDASPEAVSYLRFDLAPYAGRTVRSATLRVRATTSGSTGQQAVHLVADDDWTESGLRYSNRPALGATVGTLGPTTPRTDYTVPLDVGAVAGELGQPISLGLDTASTDGLDLGSRESPTPPSLQLVLAAP